MKKIQYGIIGFVAGVLGSLLMAIIEMKLMKRLQLEAYMPLAIGITVIVFMLTGVLTGIRLSKRY